VAGTDAGYYIDSDALGSYTDDVALSVTGLPTGASESFDNTDISASGSATATIETTGTSAGTYEFLINGELYVPSGDVFWVSPTGAASWGDAKSATPLSGTNCCSLAIANANAAAGDTVYFRDGTYTYVDGGNRAVVPAQSGTSGSRITFAAHTGETPVIQGSWVGTPAVTGVYLTHDYFVLDGLTIHNMNSGVHIANGNYNEIKNCTIYADTTYPDDWLGAVIPVHLGPNNTTASHNWFHHNAIYGFGAADSEGSDAFRIGHSGNNAPHHNTFSDNTIYAMGHSIADDYGTSNVWLNNHVHNEGWKTDGLTADLIYGTATGGASGKLIDTTVNFVTAGVVAGMYVHTSTASTSSAAAVGVVSSVTTTTNTNDTVNYSMLSYWLPVFVAGTGYAFTPAGINNAPDPPGVLPGNGKYGHRNFALSNDSGTDTAKYVLMEGNRIGFASINYSNRGAEGISLGSPGNIIRYNDIFGSDASGIGIKSYTGASHYGDNNSIYSNTFYKNGQARTSAPNDYHGQGVSDLYGYANRYKNNLLFQNGTTALDSIGDWYGVTGTFANNLGDATDAGTDTTATTDPKFIDPTMTDPTSETLPNLALQSDSEAIGGGAPLTTANGAGASSDTLIVQSGGALYFQDGTLGSILASAGGIFHADHIAIGTVGNTVEIIGINYATDTITLASSMTWSDGASVWLYKKSDGTRVLYGTAPEQGAHPVVS
jgi:hypothetical protein